MTSNAEAMNLPHGTPAPHGALLYTSGKEAPRHERNLLLPEGSSYMGDPLPTVNNEQHAVRSRTYCEREKRLESCQHHLEYIIAVRGVLTEYVIAKERKKMKETTTVI